MNDATLTIVRCVHKNLIRYLEKAGPDREFLIVDSKEALANLITGTGLARIGEIALGRGTQPSARVGSAVDFEAPTQRTQAGTARVRIIEVLRKHGQPVRRSVLIREVGGCPGSVSRYLTDLVRQKVIRRRRPSYYELAEREPALVPNGVRYHPRPGSASDRVLRLMRDASSTYDWSAAELATDLDLEVRLVHSVLGRMYSADILVRTQPGRYRLAA